MILQNYTVGLLVLIAVVLMAVRLPSYLRRLGVPRKERFAATMLAFGLIAGVVGIVLFFSTFA